MTDKEAELTKEEYTQGIFNILLAKFKGYRYVRTFGIDSTLYHSVFGEKYEPATSFEINGSPVVWANPISNSLISRAQQLFVPTNDEDGREALRLARRTMSLLSYASKGIGIKTKLDLLSPMPRVAQSAHPYEAGGLNGTDLKTLVLAVAFTTVDQDTWIGLAYYRLALNSDSEYYEFLSWWQVVELFHGNNKRKVKQWVMSETSRQPFYAEWLKKIGSQYSDVYGRLKDSRSRCAHVANSDNPQRMVIADPDDPESVKQVVQDIPIVRNLAETLLRSRPGIDRL